MPEAGGLRRLVAKPRVIVVAVAVIGVAALLVVVLFASIGKGKPPNQAEASRRMARALTDVQQAASASDGVIDATRLSKLFDKDLVGYVVDLATSEDRRALGAAARPENSSSCIFAWTAVGGAKTALVTDPNMPCIGEVALAASR